MRRTSLACSAGIAFCTSLVLPIGGADAQTRLTPAVGEPLNGITRSASDSGAFFSRRDLWWAGVTAVAAVAIMPLDQRITAAFRGSGPQGSAFLHRGARVFNGLGASGALIFGVASYGAGRVTGNKGLARVGLHTTEAIVLSGTTTALIKGIVGRQRPFLDGSDADEFRPGYGFRRNDLASFPSGHATAAFAAAAVLTEESRRSARFNPWIVGPLLYGAASLVASARVYDNKHWASDVVVGAGIGTLSGLGVARYTHAHPNNRLDGWLGVATPSLGPSAGGLALSWSVPVR